MAASTVKQLHAILSGTFDAAVRWEWMTANPAKAARKPKPTPPDPQPPTPDQAAAIINAAWEQDDEWGMLVWLLMVTVRRAELCALRREHINFDTKVLTVRRNYLVRDGTKIEKDTKTHQRRHISLDDETIDLLSEHWRYASEQALKFGIRLSEDAYLFLLLPRPLRGM